MLEYLNSAELKGDKWPCESYNLDYTMHKRVVTNRHTDTQSNSFKNHVPRTNMRMSTKYDQNMYYYDA